MTGKPVYRLKQDESGKPIWFKAQWVCRGFKQVFGQDYTHTSSPTMHMESFRALLHLAASLGWDIQQLDIKTAFLYRILPDNKDLYMVQPCSFKEPGKEGWVWCLIWGIYGTKQGSHTWNSTMNAHLLELGFTWLPCKFCIYYWKTAAGTVLMGIHIDDFLLVASTAVAAKRFKDKRWQQWQISDLGDTKFCVGIHIERDCVRRTVHLSQMALIDHIISDFPGMLVKVELN